HRSLAGLSSKRQERG
ncbi:putative Sjoegren syndrome-scleroderma autoantigen 1-like protein, partial [Naja naja]